MPEAQTAHRRFGNLLPEEQARAALLKRLAIPDDDFALLVAIGGDCAGALSILPSDRSPSREWKATPLPLDRLAQWAAFRERYAVMGDAVPPRLSLAGAQDKIPVLVEGGEIKLPGGSTPSSHILASVAGAGFSSSGTLSSSSVVERRHGSAVRVFCAVFCSQSFHYVFPVRYTAHMFIVK